MFGLAKQVSLLGRGKHFARVAGAKEALESKLVVFGKEGKGVSFVALS